MGRLRKTLPRDGPQIIRDMAAKGCMETDIARGLGLNYRTWRRLREEDPRAREAHREGRAIERDRLVGKLFQLAMDGNAVAAMFLLKTRHQFRDHGPIEGETGGAQVHITLPAAMSPEDYERLLNITPAEPQPAGQLERRGDD